MNGWIAQGVPQDRDVLLARERFDRYQEVATASIEITARVAKVTAWATVSPSSAPSSDAAATQRLPRRCERRRTAA